MTWAGSTVGFNSQCLWSETNKLPKGNVNTARDFLTRLRNHCQKHHTFLELFVFATAHVISSGHFFSRWIIYAYIWRRKDDNSKKLWPSRVSSRDLNWGNKTFKRKRSFWNKYNLMYHKPSSGNVTKEMFNKCNENLHRTNFFCCTCYACQEFAPNQKAHERGVQKRRAIGSSH